MKPNLTSYSGTFTLPHTYSNKNYVVLLTDQISASTIPATNTITTIVTFNYTNSTASRIQVIANSNAQAVLILTIGY